MQAPDVIRRVYGGFRTIPMETFTKGWWHRLQGGASRQRTVAEMVEHRRLYGSGGNCFDLALWLREELRSAGVPARIIGHDLETPKAHVAVVATDAGGLEYLCDPGDLWLQPVLISLHSSRFDGSWRDGFFPGRQVRIARGAVRLEVSYRRSGGKVGRQEYDLAPVSEDQFARACHHSQNLLRRPFCETLMPHPESGLTEHWEYDEQQSFWNLDNGPVLEEPCLTRTEWIQRISARTGIAPAILLAGFQAYEADAAPPAAE